MPREPIIRYCSPRSRSRARALLVRCTRMPPPSPHYLVNSSAVHYLRIHRHTHTYTHVLAIHKESETDGRCTVLSGELMAGIVLNRSASTSRHCRGIPSSRIEGTAALFFHFAFSPPFASSSSEVRELLRTASGLFSLCSLVESPIFLCWPLRSSP